VVAIVVVPNDAEMARELIAHPTLSQRAARHQLVTREDAMTTLIARRETARRHGMCRG